MKHSSLLAIASICLLGIIIYSNTPHSPFHFDDETHIINNAVICNISDIKAIWDAVPSRFVTNITLAANYYFGKFNVFGYHLFNIFIHLCSSIAVWWLTILTLSTPVMKNTKLSRHSRILALFVGLIFVSHPIQVESVTYIIQRTTSLAALFYILSVCFYVKSRLEQKNVKSLLYFVSSLFFAILAMFTRESTATLPFAIILYEFFFLKDGKKVKWVYLVPFLITIFIIPVMFVTLVLSRPIWFIKENIMGLPSSDYLITQVRVMITYIRLLILPINQNLDYDYHISKSLFEIPVLSSFMFLLALFAVIVLLYKRFRLMSFALLWFFLALSIESSFIPFKDVIFEHRLYLPMVGFSTFLVGSVYYIFGKKGIRPVIVILSIASILYSVLAYNRNIIWKDEVALWNDTVRKSPNKARPYNNRGFMYQRKGDLNRAISDYNKALEINPDFVEAYYNRGVVYQAKGNLDQAISDYIKVLQINPKYDKAYNNRGSCYQIKGDFDQAIADYNRALKISPNYYKAYNNRGRTYQFKGDLDHAISDYSKALEINSNCVEAYINRGVAYLIKDNQYQALSDFNKALEVNSNHAEAYYNRGVVYQAKGDLDQAVSDYSKALKINPNYIEAYYNRGVVYQAKGDLGQAMSDYSKILQIDPEYDKALNNRGFCYKMKGDLDQAIADYNRVIKIKSDYAEAFYNRGIVYQLKGRPDSAISDFNKAIGINPNYTNAYANRGNVYQLQGDIDLAISDYNRAIEIDPDCLLAYNNRALVYFLKKEYRKAWEDVRRAQSLGHKVNPAFIANLKKTLEEVGY